MPINFSLTITGLCVIVLKSQRDYPEHPSAVEILCVDAPHHRPALSYLPEEMDIFSQAHSTTPELCVGPQGERLAMLDISGKIISFDFDNVPEKDFTLSWGPSTSIKPDDAKPAERDWMNWIASVQDLGLTGIRVGQDGYIPQGASTRVQLPPGTIISQEIITDPADKVVEWEFPATGKSRALANKILYSVKGADIVRVLVNGKRTLVSTATDGDLLMSLSDDLASVPPDYNQPTVELKHLTHLEELADPYMKVQVPKAGGTGHTGRPICNQMLFVDKR